MGALWFLELRYARHQFAAIVRSPLRLAIWIPYALSIAYLLYSRAAGPHRSGFGGLTLSASSATAAGGLYLGMLGLTIGLAASGRVAAFRNTAEAVLFTNAGIRPLTVAVWLQGRKLATSWGRWFGTLVYVFLIFSPRHVGTATTVRAFGATLLAIALQMSAELPAFLLSRGRLRVPMRTAGFALALTGFAYAALGLFGHAIAEPVLAFVRLDPGFAVRAVLDGSGFAFVILGAVIGVLFVSIRLLGNDALPELYAVSQQTLASIRERRSTVPKVRFAREDRSHASRIPPGALALVWKDWIGFRRGRGTFGLWLAGCAFWSLCGAGVALATLRFDDASPLLALAGTSALLVLVAAPLGASVGLASDLAKPLFWLSASSLRSRIAAWTFAHTWRGGLAIGLAPLAAGVVLRDVTVSVVAPPLILAAYWSLQSLGVGLYALFPNPIDSRGPMMLLRTFITAAYVLPAALAGLGVVLVFHGDGIFAAFAAAATLVAEGWAVVELASLRFKEHGAALATVARAT